MTKKKSRYIGVMYKKNTEEQSHYIGTYVYQEFDIVIYLDKTNYL